MEEDSDSANWVLVDEIDCAEEAISLNLLIATVPTTLDSDQESDGSISIIGDHPTDSCSEEDVDLSKKNDITTNIMPIIKIDTEFESKVNEEDIEDQTIDSLNYLDKSEVEDQIQEVSSSHETNKDDGSSTSEPSSKEWTFADDKSKLELETTKKTFFLDCSREPILEVSPNDTDADTESTKSSSECQAIVKKEETPFKNISNRDASRERDVYISRISVGFIISMLILASSHFIQQYLDYREDVIHSPSPSNSFLDSIADNEKARPILNFCIDKQKSKGNEYSDHTIEKCVIKRLRKKNREDAVKKTEIYLQMKERILELREKELAEKEREILKKWRKRLYTTDDGHENHGKKNDKKSKEDKTSKEFNKKSRRNLEQSREGKSQENQKDISSQKGENIKDKIKTFQKKGPWIFEKAKEATNWNHKMHSKNDLKGNKEINEEKEETLKQVKNNVKKFHKDNSKPNPKALKGDNKEDPNEEWYIKYNPVKNTIELINITTLPKQDSILIKNGNKTINGQWYFSLYGSARSNIRHKEKAAEWYFRRGNLREHKRDKAKWYFDYMSARDNTRYFY